MSEKSKSLIAMDGYKFRFDTCLKNNIQRWRCSKKSCKSFLKLDSINNIIDRNTEHNHSRIEVLKRINSLDDNIKPSKLIQTQTYDSHPPVVKSVVYTDEFIIKARGIIERKFQSLRNDLHKPIVESRKQIEADMSITESRKTIDRENVLPMIETKKQIVRKNEKKSKILSVCEARRKKKLLINNDAIQRKYKPYEYKSYDNSYHYKPLSISYPAHYIPISSLITPINYHSWDDPNVLVNRLRVLIDERSIGYNESREDEIHVILRELRKEGLIE